MANIHGIAKDIVKEVQKEIVRMELIVMGDFLQSIKYEIKGNIITIYSDVEYAPYLEFGSYEFGFMTARGSPDILASTALGMKKKGMSQKERDSLPRGMVAFAPMRRVIYNDKLIQTIIKRNS